MWLRICARDVYSCRILSSNEDVSLDYSDVRFTQWKDYSSKSKNHEHSTFTIRTSNFTNLHVKTPLLSFINQYVLSPMARLPTFGLSTPLIAFFDWFGTDYWVIILPLKVFVWQQKHSHSHPKPIIFPVFTFYHTFI